MKIVQTFWTKPRLSAGWWSESFHLMSWALSCLCLRKHYQEVELYTDDKGKKILIDTLQLPYTQVHLTLNDVDFASYMWAMPKMLTYSLQEQPFLHVDGDVFIWKKFDEDKVNADFVCQNLEMEMDNASFYTTEGQSLLKVLQEAGKAPQWLVNLPFTNIRACNAGVYGGNNLAFIKEQSKLAFDLINNCRKEIESMDRPELINHFTEQVLAYYLLQEKGIPLTPLFEPLYFGDTTIHKNLFEYIDCYGISHRSVKGYVHLLGGLKNTLQVCKMLERRVKADYPVYYKRIMDNFAPKLLKPAGYQGKLPNERLSTAVFAKLFDVHVTFNRTFQMLKLLQYKGPLPQETDQFIKAMPEIAAHVITESHREQLLDCFEYERQRYEYSCSIKDNAAYAKEENPEGSDSTLLYEKNQPNLDSLNIQFNSCYHVVATRWHWADKVDNKKINTAWLNVPAHEWQTIFCADGSVTNDVYEYMLTGLQQIIVYAFSVHNDYRSALKEMETFLNDIELAAIEAEIFRNIIFLANRNILVVTANRQMKVAKKSVDYIFAT